VRKTSRAEKICTVCEKIGDIGDSVKGSSSRMKNKVGAQKGAFIKMKRENMYVYQWLCGVCYVPIIAPFNQAVTTPHLQCNPLLFVSRTGLALYSFSFPFRSSNTSIAAPLCGL
jgi:hypothetical protein